MRARRQAFVHPPLAVEFDERHTLPVLSPMMIASIAEFIGYADHHERKLSLVSAEWNDVIESNASMRLFGLFDTLLEKRVQLFIDHMIPTRRPQHLSIEQTTMTMEQLVQLLERAERLESLHLGSCSMAVAFDCSFLEDRVAPVSTSLTSLSMSMFNVVNISHMLRLLPGLKSFTYRNNMPIGPLDPAVVKRLQHLKFGEMSLEEEYVRALLEQTRERDRSSLLSFACSGSARIRNIDPIVAMIPTIRTLNISCTGLSNGDVGLLVQLLPSLRNLYCSLINLSAIEDWPPEARSASLLRLSAAACNINNIGIASIADRFPSLQQLNIAKNVAITSLDALTGARHLSELCVFDIENALMPTLFPLLQSSRLAEIYCSGKTDSSSFRTHLKREFNYLMVIPCAVPRLSDTPYVVRELSGGVCTVRLADGTTTDIPIEVYEGPPAMDGEECETIFTCPLPFAAKIIDYARFHAQYPCSCIPRPLTQMSYGLPLEEYLSKWDYEFVRSLLPHDSPFALIELMHQVKATHLSLSQSLIDLCCAYLASRIAPMREPENISHYLRLSDTWTEDERYDAHQRLREKYAFQTFQG